MKRLFAFLFCAALGVAMIFCAVQVPAHLRAVDEIVLHMAGKGTPSLTDTGMSLVKDDQLGAAELFSEAGMSARISDLDVLNTAITNLATQNPFLKYVGSPVDGTLEAFFKPASVETGTTRSQATLRPEPFTEFIVRSENRLKALELLRNSPSLLVQSLLRLRSLTNTVLFPASSSSSGQALDAAISVCGLLADGGHLSTGLSNSIMSSVTEANDDGNSQRAEGQLMDLMSLGQRFNWGQLTRFVEQVKETETLRNLASLVQNDGNRPVVYATVCLTGNAAGVANYLSKYSETGMNDLRVSLASDEGGVNELLRRNQQLCDSSLCKRAEALVPSWGMVSFAARLSQKAPWLALAIKWTLFFFGGFLLATAIHVVLRVPARERPLQVHGFHVVRELLFALGFLLVVLLLSEPFLTQDSQKGMFPFRLRLPTVGSVVTTESTGAHTTIMNQFSLLTLLLFFVLQALIYVACLVKLAEIRRQNAPARLKLKLLENEDHLFDAGLYLGFVGTIISLILVSLGVIKPSLMAAYSSTSFGIIFVSVFKIFHLRPLRRRMLLEVEDEPAIRLAPSLESAATMPS